MKLVFDLYPDGKKRALTFSYDDGSANDRRLVEIFNKFGMKGTFHLNSGHLMRGPDQWHIRLDEIGTL